MLRKYLYCLAAILLLSTGLPAQSPFRNLVMEGGGIRGIAYVGALEVLDSAGLLAGIERVGGTSAGAIQACLLAVGYTPAEIRRELESTSFKKFNDGGFMLVPGAVRLSKKMGWYKGDALQQWMEERIMAKTGDPRLTFAGLHARRQQHGGRSLYITGTDLSWQRLRVFSLESYPHMAIADAVRISANIPFYFQPVWMDSVGHTHASNDSAGSRSLVVDGGLLANYPIALFDSARYLAQGSDSGYVRNPETLGLQLEEPWLVAAPGARRRQPFPIDDNGSYMKAIYKLLVDKPVYDPQRTVLISNLALSPRVRKLPAQQVEDLLESGRVAVRRFLQEQVAQ